jgi:hypothetical protein
MGNVLHNFGGGIWSCHGISITDGNVWVTDNQQERRVIRCSVFPGRKNFDDTRHPWSGRDRTNTLDQPNAVAFAPNGDIFISEVMAPRWQSDRGSPRREDSLRRGKEGDAPGEFDLPHVWLSIRSRLLVGDRNNNRIDLRPRR